MTSRDELLAELAITMEEDDEPVRVLRSDLTKIKSDDLPIGLGLQVIEKIEQGVIHLDLNVVLIRTASKGFVARFEEHGWRKFWAGSLGVEEYHDLILTAVEARARAQGDVALLDVLNEDVLYGITFEVALPEGDLKRALDHGEHVRREVVEAAEAVRIGIDDLVASVSKRLQGWGHDPLDALIDRMRDGTPHDKGLVREELASRLFNTVPGFAATGNVRTETEEIDTRIQNTSDDALWRRETFLLIAECKNWSSKCSKDELVVFKNKLSNRVGRVTCGFLASWNGFTNTIAKEMLRSSEAQLLVVPVEGSDLRGGVRDNGFPARLKALHERAVFL